MWGGADKDRELISLAYISALGRKVYFECCMGVKLGLSQYEKSID
jgi:hypothetical protein